MDKIKIVLWDCRGFQNKKNELTEKVNDYDIIIITETKCEYERDIYFLGYITIDQVSKGNSGGTAIIIKNGIEFEIIKGWNYIGDKFDILGIRVNNTIDKINIIALYRRPITRIIKNEWNKIMIFGNKGSETITVGDFNAHNTLWSCQNTDSNGEILFEIMNDKGFLCCNQNTLFRMGNIGQASSNIDLIFGTTKIIDIMNITQKKKRGDLIIFQQKQN